jgi:hypothetical protein
MKIEEERQDDYHMARRGDRSIASAAIDRLTNQDLLMTVSTSVWMPAGDDPESVVREMHTMLAEELEACLRAIGPMSRRKAEAIVEARRPEVTP